MVDAFLIIATLVAFILLLIVALYLLVYYQHPDDHNEAYFPKFVVVFGIVIAGASVLLLPLDVANNEGYAGCSGYDTSFCGGMNMELFWSIIFWLIPIWSFLLIPFSTFYYEADDGMLMAGTSVNPNPIKKSKIASASCYTGVVVVVIFIFFLITYFAWSDTKVPVQTYTGPTIVDADGLGVVYQVDRKTNVTSGDVLPFSPNSLEDYQTQDGEYLADVVDTGSADIVVQVSVTTFYAGLMAWLGWFLFCIYGGIGLIAMPLDLILAFINRPRHMDAAEYAEASNSLKERVNELVDIGELLKIEREQKANQLNAGRWTDVVLKRKEARDERQAILDFKQAVFLLEQDTEDFQACSENYENYNPLWPFVSLAAGICAAIISFFWFLHIVLYVLPDKPIAPFLNNYFSWFDRWFPLFGVLSVALFTLYLLFCAIKGCFKFGLRFVCFTLYPMKVGKTYMSAFLFNILLVLLCTMPVVQFAQESFADYAQYATIRQVFGVQIRYLEFFSWFWTNNVFIIIFIIFNCLTLIYLLCKPKDQSRDATELRDRLKARRGGVATSSSS